MQAVARTETTEGMKRDCLAALFVLSAVSVLSVS